MKKFCILIAACAALAACDKKDEQASQTAVPAAVTQEEAKPVAQPESKPVEQPAASEQASSPAQPTAEEAKPADDEQQ